MAPRKIETTEEETTTQAQGDDENDFRKALTKTPDLPETSGNEIPDGFEIPKDLRVPKGRQVIFIRIPAKFTDTPEMGDRQIICWPLTDGDEKVATDRADGKTSRLAGELAKQMIRAIDGNVASFMKSRGPDSLDQFWRDIGSKGRNLLIRLYTKLHLPDEEELNDFFANCIAVRSTG